MQSLVKHGNTILILFQVLSSFFISFQDVRKGEHVGESDRGCANIQATGGVVVSLLIKVNCSVFKKCYIVLYCSTIDLIGSYAL